ncbi:MAG: heavy metal-associated domain-containing protein [Bacteroidales bacterium]|nr:heavy metal-associated domain-containing protein [Bacteroidales bacterium]MDD4670486.1 heavy metal-associated domain-containing protein [Bacteroidales bacterium]
MKNFVKIMIVAAVAALLSVSAYAQDNNKKSSVAEVTFVSSIDCKNCVKKVEANIPYEKGVKDLKVNLDNHTIYIKYDTNKTTKEKLAEAIVKLGYTAVEQTKDESKK